MCMKKCNLTMLIYIVYDMKGIRHELQATKPLFWFHGVFTVSMKLQASYSNSFNLKDTSIQLWDIILMCRYHHKETKYSISCMTVDELHIKQNDRVIWSISSVHYSRVISSLHVCCLTHKRKQTCLIRAIDILRYRYHNDKRGIQW